MVEIRAFTEGIADTLVRYQVTVMEGSVLIWAQQQADTVVPEGSNGGGSGGMKGMGSFPRLAAAMPGIAGYDGLPAATAVLGGNSDAASEHMASRLARRYGIPVYACVDLGDVADVAADAVFGRLVRELDAAGVGVTPSTLHAAANVR